MNRRIILLISFIALIIFGSFTIKLYEKSHSSPQSPALKEINENELIKSEVETRANYEIKETVNKQTVDNSGTKHKIDTVNSNTIKSITDIHVFLNNSVSGTNKPTEETYKQSKTYAAQLNKAAELETWDYIKYDLQHAALNLEHASSNKKIEFLLIAHKILHDLDAHVFNKNSDNEKKESFGASQTYRLTHGLPSAVPKSLPPPGA